MKIISSEKELNKVYKYLENNLPSNAIILLRGNLASGKTTLTKYIAEAKGIKDSVSSPTFSLQNCYGNTIFHYDLYRIDNGEFMELGLFEEFEKDGWHIVEWASEELEIFLRDVGYSVSVVDITPIDNRREYSIKCDNV
ncbi:TsaE protein, required for threonylcarbamoyladenosine t(6)A37 formation in tRNA [hydrothermal vent metagenome]|uniref:tRNA threonylcarbamoyladenosine biosynthesis protein TsaE n=1 Tax=hydrothermal vent metagenome TaxID=652676 RepID=A0A1W1EI92_9ZZZZ